jgi:UDP-glucose 6-dehydrogenase
MTIRLPTSFRPVDVKERLGYERMIEAAVAFQNAMVEAIRDYCLRRAEIESVKLIENPRLVREGDARDDMLYQAGFIAGLRTAANVPYEIVESVQNARDRQRER